MKYKLKFTHELFDKESRIFAMDTNEEKIIMLLSSSVMLGGKIRFEPTKEILKVQLDPVTLHYHSGPIVGMDVCIRKPLVATASKDKTIKIWNYEERTV